MIEMVSGLPVIAVTIGDPAGIGPEVVVKALTDCSVSKLGHWILIGDAWVLDSVKPETVPSLKSLPNVRVLDLKLLKPGEFTLGTLSARCGSAALEYVKLATRLCLKGEANAMVTAPINKEAVCLAGNKFSGHTEFIAELCGSTESRMLLVNEQLRVLHVSTHVALKQACDLNIKKILDTIQMGHEVMQMLGCDRPRIVVCGLNPHAGENGLFGDEDSRIVLPAVHAATKKGIHCDGPFPADTVFLKALRGQYDLVIAMYHDQGHIPMKLLDFAGTVNMSLGLPIIRTSVDHGTAFDIAGKDVADPASMRAAMKLAAFVAGKSSNRAETELPR